MALEGSRITTKFQNEEAQLRKAEGWFETYVFFGKMN